MAWQHKSAFQEEERRCVEIGGTYFTTDHKMTVLNVLALAEV